MQFFENYRKKYNDLLIAVENLDISLSDEFSLLKNVNSDKLIKYQVRKFEFTFEMLVEQMKLYLKKNHLKVPSVTASVIKNFHKHSQFSDTLYEVLLDMNISYKKIIVTFDQENYIVNNELLSKLDSYHTTMLSILIYLDYDDSKLFKSNFKNNSLREYEFV